MSELIPLIYRYKPMRAALDRATNAVNTMFRQALRTTMRQVTSKGMPLQFNMKEELAVFCLHMTEKMFNVVDEEFKKVAASTVELDKRQEILDTPPCREMFLRAQEFFYPRFDAALKEEEKPKPKYTPQGQNLIKLELNNEEEGRRTEETAGKEDVVAERIVPFRSRKKEAETGDAPATSDEEGEEAPEENQ